MPEPAVRTCAEDAAMPLDERILEDPMLGSSKGCYCCHWTGTARVKSEGEHNDGLSQIMDAVRKASGGRVGYRYVACSCPHCKGRSPRA